MSGPEPQRRRPADLRGAWRLPASGVPDVRLALGHGHEGRATFGAIEPVPLQPPGRCTPRSETVSTRCPNTPAAEGHLSGTAVAPYPIFHNE